jgi:hypothetical protein
MNKSFSALSRLASIDNVASTFICSRKEIIAREVPEKYSNNDLSQISARVLSIFDSALSLGTVTQEMSLSYENFTILIRSFCADKNHFLVVFAQSNIDLNSLKQPINLAVLALEKAVQGFEDETEKKAAQKDIALAAQQAEQAILSDQGEDTNLFYSKLQLLTFYHIGPVGPEILQQYFRELELSLPLSSPHTMKKFVEFTAQCLPSEEKRIAFLEQAEDLICRITAPPIKYSHAVQHHSE